MILFAQRKGEICSVHLNCVKMRLLTYNLMLFMVPFKMLFNRACWLMVDAVVDAACFVTKCCGGDSVEILRYCNIEILRY